MRRKLVPIVLFLASIIGIGGAGLVSPSPAGAVAVACPVGNQGWFEGHSVVYRCLIDDYNHWIIDEWNSQGQLNGVVFNAWVPDWIKLNIIPGALGSAQASIDICGMYSNAAIARAWPTGNPYWEHEFRLDYWISDPQAWLQAYAGNFNHHHGYAGAQSFGGETGLSTWSCQYGLGQKLNYG